MPTETNPTNIINSFFLTTLDSIIIEGSESAVTPIIKANAVPRPTPLKLMLQLLVVYQIYLHT